MLTLNMTGDMDISPVMFHFMFHFDFNLIGNMGMSPVIFHAGPKYDRCYGPVIFHFDPNFD